MNAVAPMLIGTSRAIQEVNRASQEIARGDWNVLIEGETGTEQELVARRIHAAGSRREGPFIAVDCTGMTADLEASQPLGHRQVDLPAATSLCHGLFEAASGGTLFLDEIRDIPTGIQADFVRVIDRREIFRLGESMPRKVNVRVIAATGRDLVEEVALGRFPRELLYRIRIARIRIPPLRERAEDIPWLVEAFLSENPASTRKPLQVGPETMRRLVDYPWPGNVRELKSAVDYAATHCKGTVLRLEDFPEEVRSPRGRTPAIDEPVQAERDSLLHALKQAGGNRSRAAELLGISRATLYRRLSELKIDDAAGAKGRSLWNRKSVLSNRPSDVSD